MHVSVMSGIATFTRSTRMMLCVAVALTTAFVALALASPVSATSQYFSGSMCSGCHYQGSAWNNYTYNEAYNCFCNGPEVEIWQQETDGTIVWIYNAAGDISQCHPASYSQTACANLASYSISETCYRSTLGSCT